MGAEAIRKLLQALDLVKLSVVAARRASAKPARSRRAKDLINRLKIVEAIRD